jgi:hypothetical protein
VRFIFVLLLFVGCAQKELPSNRPIMVKLDSLHRILPTVVNQSFSFSDSSTTNMFSWFPQSSHKKNWFGPFSPVKIDTDFYLNCLAKDDHFSSWNKYQALYYLCFLKLPNDNLSLIVLQNILNDDEANIYSVILNSQGNIQGVLDLATVSVSPDDYFTQQSRFIGEDSILSTRVYFSSDEIGLYKDSVATLSVLDNGFKTKLIHKDSLRVRNYK